MLHIGYRPDLLVQTVARLQPRIASAAVRSIRQRPTRGHRCLPTTSWCKNIRPADRRSSQSFGHGSGRRSTGRRT